MNSDEKKKENSKIGSFYDLVFRLVKLSTEKPRSHTLIIVISFIGFIVTFFLSHNFIASVKKEDSFLVYLEAGILIAFQIFFLVFALFGGYAHYRDYIKLPKKQRRGFEISFDKEYTKLPKKSRRYLGNKSTKEVHDLYNTKPQCQISEIKNFEYFEDLDDAYDEGYDNCDYCIPKIEEKAKGDECLEGHLATDY